MGFGNIQRVIGLLIAASSLMMVPPLLVSLYYGDGTHNLFLESATIFLLTGLFIFIPVRHHKQELRLREGFLVVACSWLAVVLVGALPFLLLNSPDLSLMDAAFESISGYTTTGASVITDIDALPRAINYYRMQTHWVGGMGIIVLAVAILPMLGVGGMQLFRAETSGPMKDNKLTPRITQTAKALWLVYLGITVVCAVAYKLGGMDLFDAIGHAFATTSTGGFSTHNASFGYWNSPTLEAIAVFFMFVSGMNFALHFVAWRRASMQSYFKDSELKAYVLLLVAFTILATFGLYLTNTFDSFATSFRYAVFHVVSIMTCTGFVLDPLFYNWPSFVALLVSFTAFIGGCAGSTSGGIKVIRIVLLMQQALREIRRLIHPRAVILVKYEGRPTSTTVMDAVWGFFFLFITSFAIMTILLTATGLDMVTAFSAVIACMANAGPALGEAGPHYAALNDPAKLILCFAMLLGRLEIYTLLVLMLPAYWHA